MTKSVSWTSKVSNLFWDFVHGKGIYTVKIVLVEGRKLNFTDDPEEVEEYGLALHTARMFAGKQWVLTEKNTLVCEIQRPGLWAMDAKIVVDDNLNFLSERHAQMIREGFTIEVRIPSFGRDANVEPGVGPFPITFVREIN